MARVQDLQHFDIVISRYLSFQMDDMTIGHIIKNVFREYPISVNMRDNLTLEMYKKDKAKFKQCLILEKEELARKATNIGEEGFLAQTIYVKLANLMAKMLDSSVFSKY